MTEGMPFAKPKRGTKESGSDIQTALCKHCGRMISRYLTGDWVWTDWTHLVSGLTVCEEEDVQSFRDRRQPKNHQ
jgi:hypothetical protein